MTKYFYAIKYKDHCFIKEFNRQTLKISVFNFFDDSDRDQFIKIIDVIYIQK